MGTRTRLAVALAATGALGLGGLIVMSPALTGAAAATLSGAGFYAAPGPGPGGGPGPDGGPGSMGRDGGMGGGGMGRGGGMGDCSRLDPTTPKGTLSAAQQATLAQMANGEKASHDLYVAFADRYDARVFDRISMAESHHVAAVRTLLDRYGLADPTEGQPAGQFSDPATQAEYDKLLARGSTDEKAALDVGVANEERTIADLKAALDGLTAPDVTYVYQRQITASEHHLAAFQNWAGR